MKNNNDLAILYGRRHFVLDAQGCEVQWLDAQKLRALNKGVYTLLYDGEDQDTFVAILASMSMSPEKVVAARNGLTYGDIDDLCNALASEHQAELLAALGDN